MFLRDFAGALDTAITVGSPAHRQVFCGLVKHHAPLGVGNDSIGGLCNLTAEIRGHRHAAGLQQRMIDRAGLDFILMFGLL